MANERRDPVPAGRYSLFLKPEEEQRWRDWLNAHSDTVKPLRSVPHQKVRSNTAIFSITWMGDVIQDYAGSSVLFELAAPTPWVGLGLPTIETGDPDAWVKAERDGLLCYWAWTTAGPQVICDPKGPEQVSVIKSVAPWALAAFLGWVWLSKE
jgi:hypothetical protein